MTVDNEMANGLFSVQGEDVVNVKFFRGRRDDVITAEELKAQAHAACMQDKIGSAIRSAVAPRSAHPKRNALEFVASL